MLIANAFVMKTQKRMSTLPSAWILLHVSFKLIKPGTTWMYYFVKRFEYNLDS